MRHCRTLSCKNGALPSLLRLVGSAPIDAPSYTAVPLRSAASSLPPAACRNTHKGQAPNARTTHAPPTKTEPPPCPPGPSASRGCTSQRRTNHTTAASASQNGRVAALANYRARNVTPAGRHRRRGAGALYCDLIADTGHTHPQTRARSYEPVATSSPSPPTPMNKSHTTCNRRHRIHLPVRSREDKRSAVPCPHSGSSNMHHYRQSIEAHPIPQSHTARRGRHELTGTPTQLSQMESTHTPSLQSHGIIRGTRFTRTSTIPASHQTVLVLMPSYPSRWTKTQPILTKDLRLP
jgi:hypothetical protein